MEADSLTKATSADGVINEQVRFQYIPSIDILEVQQIDGEANSTTPTISHLKDSILPKEKEVARRLRVKAAKFILMDEVLHKRGLSQPYLRCLISDESTLVHKTVRVGYYWLSMQINTESYDRACDKCQYLSNVPRQPSKYLTPMVALWPFAW